MDTSDFGQIELASHESFTVDFESPVGGVTTNPSFSVGGVTVTTSADGNGTCPDEATLYDADGAIGSDPDLEQGDGNVLIIAEDPTKGETPPSDCAIGGVLTVNFSTAVTLHEITVLDVEHDPNPADKIELFGAGNVLLATFGLPQTGNGGIGTVDLGDTEGVVKLVLTYRPTEAGDCALGQPNRCASIAIDDIDFSLVHEEGGGEGCTPGFWKNNLTKWPVAYDPGDDFDTVFGVDAFDPDLTLEEALNNGGGGIDALGRHAVAALLSAASIDYPFTEAQVIALVQDAVDGDDSDGEIEDAKDELAAANELGCPISASGDGGNGNSNNTNSNSNGNGNGNGNGNRR